MTTTEKIQTLGPADPNAPFMAKFYALIGSVGSIATFLQTLHLLTTEQAASIHTVGSDATTLVLSVGALIAAFRTRKQVNNGTFTKAPEPAPELAPEDQVKQGLKVLVDNATATTTALNNASQMASEVLGLGSAGLRGTVDAVGGLVDDVKRAADDAISKVLLGGGAAH